MFSIDKSSSRTVWARGRAGPRILAAQALDAQELGVHWAGVLSLERVHAYDPVPRLRALGLEVPGA